MDCGLGAPSFHTVWGTVDKYGRALLEPATVTQHVGPYKAGRRRSPFATAFGNAVNRIVRPPPRESTATTTIARVRRPTVRVSRHGKPPTVEHICVATTSHNDTHAAATTVALPAQGQSRGRNHCCAARTNTIPRPQPLLRCPHKYNPAAATTVALPAQIQSRGRNHCCATPHKDSHAAATTVALPAQIQSRGRNHGNWQACTRPQPRLRSPRNDETRAVAGSRVLVGSPLGTTACSRMVGAGTDRRA